MGMPEKDNSCTACNGLGYKGRVGIYEIMTMTKEIENLILTGNVSEYQMAEIASKQGMISMAQDGLLKALDGITSVEEILRVAEIQAATEDIPDTTEVETEAEVEVEVETKPETKTESEAE